MIPENITREHIKRAAAQIDEQGVPPNGNTVHLIY